MVGVEIHPAQGSGLTVTDASSAVDGLSIPPRVTSTMSQFGCD
jgi:hypothetical protein